MTFHPDAPIRPAAGNRTHVLQVVGNAIVGGMETCVTRLVERLPRERFRVTVLCPWEGDFSERLRALGVEVLVTPMPEDPPWASIQLACELVKAGGIDVLHAHMSNAHLLAGLVGRLTGKPVLTTVHAWQLATVDVQIQRLVGSHIGVVCQPSYFHALGMGVNPAQLSCIPNGVDTDTFQPAAGRFEGQRLLRPGGLRERLGVPATAPLVGFVGRLSPEKGPETFARAMLLLVRLRPEVHAVMVGDGPSGGAVRALAERFGIADRLHLAGERADMPAVYAELDLLVSTSNSEALPLAMMEAMACGLPVVATRVGGVPDLVAQGRCGWLVAAADFEGIAARAASVLGTPGEARRMGRQARERVVERFSLADSVERTAQLLSRLAAGASGGKAQPRISAVPSEAASGH